MIRFIFSLLQAAVIFDNFKLNFLPKRVYMPRHYQDIMPRTLTCQTKTDHVKLKQMTSLNGLALFYFARDVRGARWLSGRVSDSGARGRGFETYRRRVVSLSKTLYSLKVLVNYPGSGCSVPT